MRQLGRASPTHASPYARPAPQEKIDLRRSLGVHRTGRYVAASKAARRVLGIAGDGVGRFRVGDLVEPRERAFSISRWRRFVSGEPGAVGDWFRRPDGRVVVVHYTSLMAADDDVVVAHFDPVDDAPAPQPQRPTPASVLARWRAAEAERSQAAPGSFESWLLDEEAAAFADLYQQTVKERLADDV